MKAETWWIGALLGATLLASGCEMRSTAADDPSWFTATVDGAISARYTGTGDFYAGRDHEGRAAFSLSSDGTGEAAGQSFLLHRSGAGIPARGTYSLGRRAGDFRAVYLRQAEGMLQGFAAQSGELTVLEASSQRVRGTFRLVGTQYCERALQGSSAPRGTCDPAAAPAAGAPSVEIAGSFTVTPLRGGLVLE